MSWINKADTALIEKVFEPVAHKIEQWVSVDNFNLARFGIVAYGSGVVAQVFTERASGAFFYIWVTLAMVTPLMVFGNFMNVRDFERAAAKGFKNTAKIVWRPQRYVQGFFTVLLWSTIAFGSGVTPFDIGQVLFFLGVYFASCDRPPPQEEREPLFSRPVLEGS